MRNFIAVLFLLSLVLIPSVADAGHTNGPQSHYDSVDPHSIDTYKLFFEGEEDAFINVSGDGSTDLDCYVYDGGDHLIVSDSDSTDHCVLRWTPRWTGKFTLKIKNRGRFENTYRVRTN
jgi:hypothetical protein